MASLTLRVPGSLVHYIAGGGTDWRAHAKLGKGRLGGARASQGEHMSDARSDSGQTLWQWDENQPPDPGSA